MQEQEVDSAWSVDYAVPGVNAIYLIAKESVTDQLKTSGLEELECRGFYLSKNIKRTTRFSI